MTDATDLQALLAHDGFLRALGAHLVSDAATRDDLVQETYVRALAAPPGPERPLKAWLATVLRNAARRMWRTDARRRRREERTSRPETVRSPESVLERERVRREIVEAVLRLDVPHRDVVLLRFYDGLPPREVARRLGVGVETVRTRTRRAVERLRADLTRRHGSPASWQFALAPVAGSVPGPLGVPLGGIAMSAKTKALVAAPLVLAVLATGALLWPRERSIAREEEPTQDLTASTSAEVRLAGRRQARSQDEEQRALADLVRASRPGRTLGKLRGFVVRGESPDGVAGVRVTARPTRGRSPYGAEEAEMLPGEVAAHTDREGRFLFSDVPAGAYVLSAADPTLGDGRVTATSGGEGPWIVLRLAPKEQTRLTRVIRVVDPSGEPVAGAQVELALGFRATKPVAETEADGYAGFDEVLLEDNPGSGFSYVTARAGARLARAYLERHSREPQVLVLDAPGTLEGRLRGPDGATLRGTRVEAFLGWAKWAAPPSLVDHAFAAEDGSFRFDGLAAGTYALTVTPPDGLHVVFPPSESPNFAMKAWDYGPIQVQVAPGKTAHRDVDLVRGGVVEGRVVGAETGAPVSGALVEFLLPQTGRNEDYRLEGALVWRLDSASAYDRTPTDTFRVLRTDERGRYRATGLLPGPYRVTVAPLAGFALDRREDVPVADGVTQTLEHRVETAGTLEVVGRPFTTLALHRPGDAQATFAWVSPQRGPAAAAQIPGLAPGQWTLSTVHSDPSFRPIALANFAIRAGETTFLDLSSAGETKVSGRLLEQGRPVAGARLHVAEHGYGSAALLTDEEGRFSWRCTRWQAGDTQMRVALPTSHALQVSFPTGEGRELELPSGGVAVRVLDVRRDPLPGVKVELSLGGWQNPTSRVGTSVWTIGREIAPAVTDAEGLARWRFLPAGTYAYRARCPSGLRLEGKAVVEAGEVEVVLEEQPTGTCRVRVETDDGRPAANALVSAQWYPPGYDFKRPRYGPSDPEYVTYSSAESPVTDASGTVVVTGLPGGTVRLYAYTARKGSAPATHQATSDAAVTVGREFDVTLRLTPVPPPRPKKAVEGSFGFR